MKNPAECAKRLSALLRGLPRVDPRVLYPEEPPDPIETLVFSFLLWESTRKKAETAYRNLTNKIVDFNDLRVCMPEEMLAAIGSRYPRGLERCQRLRASLRDIYKREHAMTLESVVRKGKREARLYLETLEGMAPYVAARVSLLAFGAHAVPVDEQLRERLIAAAAAEDEVTVTELSSWLERHIKADKALQAHFALQRWVDRGGSVPRTLRASTRRSTASRKPATTKKKKKTASGRSR